MLKEITIKRFKTLEEIKLPLDSINLLIGANNSGKSSVLHAVQFAVSVAQTMKSQGAEWKQGALDLSFPPDKLVYSPMRDIAALRLNRRFAEGFPGIEIEFTGSPPTTALQAKANLQSFTTKIEVTKGRGQNIKCVINGHDLGKFLTLMDQPYSVFVPGLAGIPTSEEFRSEVLVKKAAARGDANNVFRNVLWLLRRNQSQWDKFTTNLRTVFPEMMIEVEFKENEDELIRCDFFKRWVKLPIDAAGTGVLQTIQILAYISLYRPKLLILDEPDAHLHPDNQRRLIRLVRDLAANGAFQVILSSHSRHLLDELDGSARIHWLRAGKRVPDSEYDSITALFDIGALDRGDMLRAGKVKCVLLTEDDDPTYIKELLKASGVALTDVEVWSYRGCSKIDTVLALAQVVARHAPNTSLLLHRDRDYLNNDEVAAYCQTIKKACPTCTIFITDGTDAESHFLSIDHLTSVITGLSRSQIEELVKRATSDMENDSQAAYVNSRLQIASQRLKKEGKNVDVGAFAVTCTQAFQANKDALRHGKRVLKRLRHLLQMEHSVQPRILQSSTHLSHPTLVSLAQTLSSSIPAPQSIRPAASVSPPALVAPDIPVPHSEDFA